MLLIKSLLEEMNRESLKSLIIRHEGLSLVPYKDSVGKLTIGVGRCLETQGITPIEANYLLDNDLNRVVSECRSSFAWFDGLCDSRQNVIASLVFNLGLNGFKGFVKLIAAVERKDFYDAANEMLLSKWAGQVGERAVELSSMMRDGDTIH